MANKRFKHPGKGKLIHETYAKVVSEGGSPGQQTWDKQAKDTIKRVQKKLYARKRPQGGWKD
jgi:hypothetical protein